MHTIGVLTPSSDMVSEPDKIAMLAGPPDVIAQFALARVTEIALNETALG